MSAYQKPGARLWIQAMALPDIFGFILRSFKASSVYYDESRISVPTRRLLDVLKIFGLCRNFHAVSLLMARKDGEGFTSVQNIFKDMDDLTNIFLEKYIAAEPEIAKKGMRSYIALSLHDAASFISMAKSAAIEAGIDRREIFYIRRHPLNRMLIDHYRKEGGIDVAEYGFWDTVKFYMRPYLRVAASAILAHMPRESIHNIDTIRPSVWVEYSPVDFIDFAFWAPYIEKGRFDIVAYFDRHDYGDIDTVKAKVMARGFKWADLCFSDLARLGRIDLRRIFEKAPCRGYRNLPLWVNMFRIEYGLSFLLYESVFKKFKVKVLIQHQEAFWRQAPQAAAIESAGGVMIGYNWSNYYFRYLPTHIFPQHLYFVWGDKVRQHIEKIDKPRNILPSGVWTMRSSDKPPELESLDKKLKFRMAIFDNTAKRTIHHSPEMLSRFYLKLLELLEKNAGWGGIVKGKNYGLSAMGSLPDGEKIITKIDALIKANRLVVLSRDYDPLAAAAYADLSVCFGINSAGIISGLSGFRAIHWDCAGVLRYIEDTKYYEDVTYSSLEKLADAITQSAAGDKTVGDFSRWRRQFNYFDDFNAPKRVAGFIEHFMESVSSKSDAGSSLDFAIKRYTAENITGVDREGIYLKETYA